MKKFNFVLIFGITCILTMCQLQLPAMAKIERGIDYECPKFGLIFLSDQFSCNHYYVCNFGILSYLSCPFGLHFNKVLSICDLPINANCDVQAVTPIL